MQEDDRIPLHRLQAVATRSTLAIAISALATASQCLC